MKKQKTGFITLITGVMGSGKTAELIDQTDTMR